MEVEEARRTVVFREYREGGARPKGLVGWGHVVRGGKWRGKETPQKKSCWEQRFSAPPGPFHLAVPLSPQQGLLPRSSHPSLGWAALSPGPAGLTQWILPPKLKLL